MNILLLGKPFYNYHERIIAELHKKGHHIIFFSDVPPNHLAIKRAFGSKVERRFIDAYQKSVLKKCVALQCDYVIVLVGRYLSRFFISALKRQYIGARFVLYLWDDIYRVENFESVRDLYDEIFSFDISDCDRNKEFTFLPLFYSEEYTLQKREKTIDIYGAFSDHSERKMIAKSVYKQAMKNNMTCRFYLFPGRYKYYAHYVKNKELEKETNHSLIYIGSPISSTQNVEYTHNSKALLDVQYSSQNGLTMRTIESIGAGVKIITTNRNIKYYDFYHPSNCLIIDRKEPIIDFDFFRIPYKKLPDEIYDKYSIRTWISVLIGEMKKTYLL